MQDPDGRCGRNTRKQLPEFRSPAEHQVQYRLSLVSVSVAWSESVQSCADTQGSVRLNSSRFNFAIRLNANAIDLR